jgi:Ca2+-binding EF-hand superfamily protein
MSKKKLGWIAGTIAGVSLAAAGIVAAQGVKTGPKGADFAAKRAEMLQKYDVNKDGKLDDTERKAAFEAMRAEHEAERAAKLKQFDKNADGKLDDAERTAMHDAQVVEHFNQLDTDKNGSISLSEFKAARPEHEHGMRGFGPGVGRGGKRGGFGMNGPGRGGKRGGFGQRGNPDGGNGGQVK